MHNLLFAILFSTLVFVIFKFFKKFNIDNIQAIAVNYLTATSIGYFWYDKEFTPREIIAADWFPIVLIIGFGFIAAYFLYAISSQKIGIAITAVSSKMSVIIPAVAGFLLFDEEVVWQKVAGIALTLIALFLILRQNQESKSKKKENLKLLLLLPIVIFLLTGTNDVMMKYTEEHFVKNDMVLMLSTIYLVAFVWACLILWVAIAGKKSKFAFKNIIAGLILGLTNFCSTYFLFHSMESFESSFMFPILNISVVCLSAIIGLLFFKEKLSKINYIGIILAILAIFILSL